MSDLERDGPGLWRRYRVAALTPFGAASEPDPGLLAGYLEGRLDEAEAEPVETWLARNPDAVAMMAAPVPDPGPAPLELIRRARALVSAQPVRPTWRYAVAWASIAASLVLVGATGFMAGHDALDDHETITSIAGGELVDGLGGGEGDGAVF
jgi:hypothetical protein